MRETYKAAPGREAAAFEARVCRDVESNDEGNEGEL